MQWYAGISGESIDFPNHAAAEIDFYGGFRPTFDKLALDFGVWEYYYPGGKCFNAHRRTRCRAALAGRIVLPGLSAERQRGEGQRELLRILRQGHLHV